MFPISWNNIFRKKDGGLITMDEAMSGGGGGGSLPPHSAADAGKVLGVTNDGSLAWITVSGGGHNAYRASSLTVVNVPSAKAEEVNQ